MTAKIWTLSLILSSLLIVSSCATDPSKGVMHPSDPASIFTKPVEKIAVFPTQNATHGFVILYSGKGGVIEKIPTMFNKRTKAPATPTFANPLFIQDFFDRETGRLLLKKGYEVVGSQVVRRAIAEVEVQQKAATPFELSLTVPADAFFLLTITQWNSERFSAEGRVEAGFEIALIRSNNGEVLWTKKIPRRLYRLDQYSSSSMVPNHRRQEELLQDIAFRLIKDFPKPTAFNAGHSEMVPETKKT